MYVYIYLNLLSRLHIMFADGVGEFAEGWVGKLLTHRCFQCENSHTIHIQNTYNSHTIHIQYTYNTNTEHIQYTYNTMQ